MSLVCLHVETWKKGKPLKSKRHRRISPDIVSRHCWWVPDWKMKGKMRPWKLSDCRSWSVVNGKPMWWSNSWICFSNQIATTAHTLNGLLFDHQKPELRQTMMVKIFAVKLESNAALYQRDRVKKGMRERELFFVIFPPLPGCDVTRSHHCERLVVDNSS